MYARGMLVICHTPTGTLPQPGTLVVAGGEEVRVDVVVLCRRGEKGRRRRWKIE